MIILKQSKVQHCVAREVLLIFLDLSSACMSLEVALLLFPCFFRCLFIFLGFFDSLNPLVDGDEAVAHLLRLLISSLDPLRKLNILCCFMSSAVDGIESLALKESLIVFHELSPEHFEEDEGVFDAYYED